MDSVFSYVFLPEEVSDVTAYSPWFEANCGRHRMIVALECGNEVNLVSLATADRLGCHVVSCERRLRLADSNESIHVVGVTSLSIERGGSVFLCEAVVVESLSVDVIAGRPFVRDYDVSFRAATCQVFFPDGVTFVYETPIPPHSGVGSHIPSVPQAPPISPSVWEEEESGALLSDEEFLLLLGCREADNLDAQRDAVTSVCQAPHTPPSAWKEEECDALQSEEESDALQSEEEFDALQSEEEFDAPPSEEEFDAPPSVEEFDAPP